MAKSTVDFKATVKWSELTHARGKATRMPGILAALRDPAKQRESIEAIGQVVVVRGVAHNAAAPVIAPVLQLAVDQSIPNRAALFDLLIWIVALGEPGQVDFTGIDLDEAATGSRYATPEAAAILEAIQAQAGALDKLLEDRDPHVQAAVAHLLGILPHLEPALMTALCARLEREATLGVTMSVVLALAILGHNVDSLRPAALEALAKLRSRSGLENLVAGGVAAALSIASRKLFDGVGVEDLCRFFVGMAPLSQMYIATLKERPWANDVSWKGGRIDSVVSYALRRSCDEGARDAVVSALAHVMATTPMARFSAFRKDWPDMVLDESLAARKLYDDPLPRIGLADRPRALLIELSQIPNEGTYEAHGIPPDIRSRRRFLGLDAEGVMERLLPHAPVDPFAPVPVWRIARWAIREWQRVHPDIRWSAEPTRVLEFMRASPLEALSGDDWLDLWMELNAEAYGIQAVAFVVKAALDAATPKQRSAFATRWASEIRRWPENLGSQGYFVFYALSKDLAPGETFPDTYDDIFTFHGLAADVPLLFARFSAPRRESIALREIDHYPDIAAGLLGFAHLAPGAAEVLRRRRAPG